MSVLLDIVMFLFGWLFGFLWFFVIALPLIYGFPRALLWSARGWAKWWSPVRYLGSFFLWVAIFAGIALILTIFLPSVAAYMRDSFMLNIGSIWGVVLTAGRAFSKSGRRDLRHDFSDFMRPYLTSAGVAAVGR